MRSELAEVKANLDHLHRECLAVKSELKFRALRRALKANFDPDQQRDEEGQWTDASSTGQSVSGFADETSDAGQVFSIFADVDSIPFDQRVAQIGGSHNFGSETELQSVGATVTYSNAVTGDERIDRTTETLTRTLQGVINVFDFIPASTPRLYGTAVHSAFGAAVKLQNMDNVTVELSFKDETRATYGDEGSVRADVALRNVADEVIAIYDLKTGSAVVKPSRADELRRHFRGSNFIPVIELHAVRGSRIKHATWRAHF